MLFLQRVMLFARERICFPGGWTERSRRMEWKRRRTYGVERDSRKRIKEMNLDFFYKLYTCKIYILQIYIDIQTHAYTFEQSHLII